MNTPCDISNVKILAVVCLLIFIMMAAACSSDSKNMRKESTDSKITAAGGISADDSADNNASAIGEKTEAGEDDEFSEYEDGDSETASGYAGSDGVASSEETSSSDNSYGTTGSSNQSNTSGSDTIYAPGSSSVSSGSSASGSAFGSESSNSSGSSQTEPVFDTMPVLKIQTAGGAAITSKEVYVSCTVSSGNCPDEYLFTDSAGGIRIRGNSTAEADKKPYRIKFDKKQSVFGLNDGAECKSWCLMADYFDHSMLRTSTAFSLGNVLLEDDYYCSDWIHTEVYINGRYQGVYLLCEQSQINKNRVNIYEKNDTETTLAIGYLMIGQGGRTDEEYSIVVSLDKDVTDLNGETLHLSGMNFSLSGDGYTQAQMDYIEKWSSAVLNTVWYALYQNKYYTVNSDGTMVPKTDFPAGATQEEKQQLTIGAVMDLDSAVRMYILDEIVKNFDAGTFNMYVDLSANGNHKLTFGVPWDYDFSLGNSKYASTHSATGIYAGNFTYSDGYRTNCLYALLNNADWFREMVKKKWNEKYSEFLDVAESVKSISEFGEDEFASNYKKWDTLGTIVMGHQADDVYSFKTQMDAADYLYTWLITRLNWLNNYWNGAVSSEDLLSIDFSDVTSLQYVGDYKCSYGAVSGGALKVTVSDPYDPYFYIDYSLSESIISAGKYKTLEVTCMVPESNSYDTYMAELFLACGSADSAEAGKSVYIEIPADGQYHTHSVNLNGVSFWKGTVNKIRVDFFMDSSVNDQFYLKTITLK